MLLDDEQAIFFLLPRYCGFRILGWREMLPTQLMRLFSRLWLVRPRLFSHPQIVRAYFLLNYDKVLALVFLSSVLTLKLFVF